MKQMPTNEEIRASVSKVGYQNIILDSEKNTVFLKLKGMKIGFGAIGKGYAADKAKALLISKGVSSGISTWWDSPFTVSMATGTPAPEEVDSSALARTNRGTSQSLEICVQTRSLPSSD